MKRIIVIALIALSMAGCAQLQAIRDTVDLSTASVANPVTREKLDSAEAGLQLAFAGLNTYRRACVQGLADLRCKENIRAIQVYTKAIPPFLDQARKFVDNNDQINAATVYNSLLGLISAMRQAATDRGVKLETVK